ncbi:hypothetical protein Q2941_42980 [Bradyrhizobium sp. UFLA05-153]
MMGIFLMKLTAEHLFPSPEAAARKLVEIASGIDLAETSPARDAGPARWPIKSCP